MKGMLKAAIASAAMVAAAAPAHAVNWVEFRVSGIGTVTNTTPTATQGVFDSQTSTALITAVIVVDTDPTEPGSFYTSTGSAYSYVYGSSINQTSNTATFSQSAVSANFIVADGRSGFSRSWSATSLGTISGSTTQSYVGAPYVSQTFFANASALQIVPAVFSGPRTFELLISEVPEPGSWALMLSGFMLVGAAMRRKHVRTMVRYS